MKYYHVTLLLLLLASGCSLFEPHQEAVKVTLSLEQSTVLVDQWNAVVIKNEGARPIRVRSCDGVILDIEKQGESWTEASGINNPCLAIYAIEWQEIYPGQVWLEHFALYEKGVYRLVLRPQKEDPVYSIPFSVE